MSRRHVKKMIKWPIRFSSIRPLMESHEEKRVTGAFASHYDILFFLPKVTAITVFEISIYRITLIYSHTCYLFCLPAQVRLHFPASVPCSSSLLEIVARVLSQPERISLLIKAYVEYNSPLLMIDNLAKSAH